MNCEVSRVGEEAVRRKMMISWDTEPLRGMDYSQIAWHQGFLNEDEEWLSMINKNMF